MTLLSKILNQEWSVPYNCYEVGHIWTPHCTDAAVDLFLCSFVESLKVYTPLYLASQIIFSRKFDGQSSLETIKSILRSSSFIGFNLFSILSLFCLCRIIPGRFYYRIHVFFPTFISSMFAILIEKPSRRFQLAIYIANLATECLFRYHVDKGNIRSLPKGEVIVFSLSMATLLYVIKQSSFGHDPVSLALKVFLGTAESGRVIEKAQTFKSLDSPVIDSNDNVQVTSPLDLNHVARKIVDKKSNFLTHLLDTINTLRHDECCHVESSCFKYVANGFFKPFVYSWLAMSSITVVRKLKQITREPSLLQDAFISSRSVNFALFLASFASTFKGCSCLLRFYSNGNRSWHGFVAGLMAGPTMLFKPNSTISLYIMWKALESLYWKGVSNGYVTHTSWNANILYSLAVSQVAFCILLQPKYMRPSYMKFIDQISGHRFHQMNRLPLNILVPEAVCGYEEYMPNLHHSLMTNKFMESLFVWLI